MRSLAQIIALWPSAEHFADAIGAKHRSYGRVLKVRGRIPEKYWPVILILSRRFEQPVTLEELRAINDAAKAKAVLAVPAEVAA